MSDHTPSLSRIHHLSLTVTDLDRSLTWYETVLGFQRESVFDRPGFRRARLHHGGGSLTLTLTEHEGGDKQLFDETATGLDHVALHADNVGDIEVWKRRFEEYEVDHSDVKPTVSGKGRFITLRDPDHIQLEVFASGD